MNKGDTYKITNAKRKGEGHGDFYVGHSRRSGIATTLAATLYHELTTKDYTVWLDVKMSDPSTDAMKEGVQNCKLFLAIITGPCMNEDNPTDPPEKNAYFKQCSIDFNPGNPSNPANPFSLQISSQLVTRGAGGRGEALGYIYRIYIYIYI